MSDTNITTGKMGSDPELTKVFAFGKIAAHGDRKINAVEVEMHLRVHYQTRNTIDLEPVTGYVEFSATGSVWNAHHTDIIGGGQNLEEIAKKFGQLGPNRAIFKRILTIWRQYHLNGTTAGTRAQNECIAKAKAEAIADMEAQGYKMDRWGHGYRQKENGETDWTSGRHYYGQDHYKWAIAELKAEGLYAVPYPDGRESGASRRWWGEHSLPQPVVYTYGSQWLVDPLPADVFTEIVDLICDSPEARARFERWAAENRLTLVPFGDAFRPVVAA